MKINNGRNSASSNFTQAKTVKLKDGDQIYRILPAIGDLADANIWHVFYGVHWGYKTTDGKKKPFASPEKKDHKVKPAVVVIPDAAKDRLNMLKGKLEEAKKSGNQAIINKLQPLVGFGKDTVYNLDSNHHMNAIDASGNIVVLKIKHKCFVQLEALIKKLEASGTYPLSLDDGRYFVFTRTGMGNDTGFAVNVLQEDVEVQGYGKMKRDVSHVVTHEIISRLSKEAGKLDQLFVKPTADQVARIVETSNLDTGVSPYMDELFSKAAPAAADNSEGNDDGDYVPEKAPVPVAAAPAPAPVITPVSAPVAAAPQATVSPIKPAPAAVKLGVVLPKTNKVSIEDMSQEDFLAGLENGTL